MTTMSLARLCNNIKKLYYYQGTSDHGQSVSRTTTNKRTRTWRTRTRPNIIASRKKRNRKKDEIESDPIYTNSKTGIGSRFMV